MFVHSPLYCHGYAVTFYSVHCLVYSFQLNFTKILYLVWESNLLVVMTIIFLFLQLECSRDLYNLSYDKLC